MSMTTSGLGAPTQPEIDERTEYAIAIQEFAQTLVDDPTVSDMLARAGIGGELSAEEFADINARFGLDRHFVEKHVNFFSLDQQAVILSLARRVVAGWFGNATGKDSFEYVFKRVFAFRGNLKWQHRIKDVQVTFDAYYRVLKEFHTWRLQSGIDDQIKEEKKARLAEYDAADEAYNEDDLNTEVTQPLRSEERRMFRKYGLICDLGVWGVSNGLLNENSTVDDFVIIDRQTSNIEFLPYSKENECE